VESRMTNSKDSNERRTEGSNRASHHMRLPGFVSDEDIGLGDIIQRATSYIGIQTCGGCKQRQIALNRWLNFSGRRPG